MGKFARKFCTEAVKRQIAYHQNYCCNICSEMLPSAWCVDHILPLHMGGGNQQDNLQVICANCHAGKTQAEAIDRAARERERKTRKSRFFSFC
jgi:5-methylcytosine-specific restriction endonuclease McrA